MEETMTTMPMWMNMALAVLTALGGIELVKYLLSLRANRRKDKAEAKQQEATAGQQDAELREKELHVLNQIAEAAKGQLEEWKHSYEALKAEKEEDRKIKAELRMDVAKLKRQVAGLQEKINEETSLRKGAERLYCDNEACTIRHPPKGTYHSEIMPRNSKGQFVSRKTE